MKGPLNPWIARLLALLRGLGPYAVIELLLPGGSVIALLIWLCRQRISVGDCALHGPDLSYRSPVLVAIHWNPATLVTPWPLDICVSMRT
jgi:hypothetical protein